MFDATGHAPAARAEQLLCRNGNSILVDGYNLSVPAVAAAARYNAPVVLDDSPGVRERLQQSRDVIVSKMDAGKSVYGVSTGYGGSGEYRPLTLNDPPPLTRN